MKLTKRTGITIFIFTITLLSVSLLFKSSITGSAVFSAEVFNYQIFDYLVMILSGVVIATALSMFVLSRTEQGAEEELKRFKVDKPNVPSIKLEKYINHCLSQERDEAEIKNALIKTGWNEHLVNYAFEHTKART